MPISRYRNNTKLEKHYYSTFEFPPQDVIDNIATFQVVFSSTDRLDILAYKHLGAGEYWWIIAMINNIGWGMKPTVGDIIKIPIDVNEVLKLF